MYMLSGIFLHFCEKNGESLSFYSEWEESTCILQDEN